MLKLCRVNIERSDEVYARIDKYVQKVIKALNPLLIVLFGSFATGDFHEASDVDIMVVADFKEGFLDRIGVLMDLNTFGLPLEPVGYTPAEFEKMRASGNFFLGEVMEKGKVLFQAPPHQA